MIKKTTIKPLVVLILELVYIELPEVLFIVQPCLFHIHYINVKPIKPQREKCIFGEELIVNNIVLKWK